MKQIKGLNLLFKLEHASESPAELTKTHISGSCPWRFLFNGSGVEGAESLHLWQFQGDADAAGPGTSLWEPPSWKHWYSVQATQPQLTFDAHLELKALS